MARGDFPSSKQDQFVLRFPDGMRDLIKEAAERNGRSMNAEIAARLESSFRTPFPELSGEGFWALISRMDAVVEASEDLYMRQRDALKELEARLKQGEK